jgi:hypothetical protein
VWFLLQSQWEENMRGELMSDGIDRFDLESHAQAKAIEVNRLADDRRPFRLHPRNVEKRCHSVRFAHTISTGAATTAAGQTDRLIVPHA